jgi:hypothetical protein
MNLEGTKGSAFRFVAFVGEIVRVIGHVDRERPLNDYCAAFWSRRVAGAWSRSRR